MWKGHICCVTTLPCTFAVHLGGLGRWEGSSAIFLSSPLSIPSLSLCSATCLLLGTCLPATTSRYLYLRWLFSPFAVLLLSSPSHQSPLTRAALSFGTWDWRYTAWRCGIMVYVRGQHGILLFTVSRRVALRPAAAPCNGYWEEDPRAFMPSRFLPLSLLAATKL